MYMTWGWVNEWAQFTHHNLSPRSWPLDATSQEVTPTIALQAIAIYFLDSNFSLSVCP